MKFILIDNGKLLQKIEPNQVINYFLLERIIIADSEQEIQLCVQTKTYEQAWNMFFLDAQRSVFHFRGQHLRKKEDLLSFKVYIKHHYPHQNKEICILASQTGLAYACESIQSILPENYILSEKKPSSHMMISFYDEDHPRIEIQKELRILKVQNELLNEVCQFKMLFESIITHKKSNSYITYKISRL